MTGRGEDQELDLATVRIRDRAEDLATYVATWQDQDRGGADRRRALSEAVSAIDAMVQAAHQLRQSLVSQGRRFDDDAMRRAAELLTRIEEKRQS